MKIKARVTALGHMGDVYFDIYPFAELLDEKKIPEANKIVRKEVLNKILNIDFQPSGTMNQLTQITWEIIE